MKASIDSAEKNINDEGKDHSKSVKKDLPKAAFITPMVTIKIMMIRKI